MSFNVAMLLAGLVILLSLVVWKHQAVFGRALASNVMWFYLYAVVLVAVFLFTAGLLGAGLANSTFLLTLFSIGMFFTVLVSIYFIFCGSECLRTKRLNLSLKFGLPFLKKRENKKD